MNRQLLAAAEALRKDHRRRSIALVVDIVSLLNVYGESGVLSEQTRKVSGAECEHFLSALHTPAPDNTGKQADALNPRFVGITQAQRFIDTSSSSDLTFIRTKWEGQLMPAHFSSDRRRVLISLAGILPAAALLRPFDALAAQNDNVFLRVSRIITGTDALSADIARRIQDLLAGRDNKFTSKLSDLASAMQMPDGKREEVLSSLSETQVKFALTIAKPWYLGYVGTPSSFVLKDDAAFATFLEAQSYQKIIDFVPRPTYPNGSAGAWAAAPDGIDAPAMPAQIKDWTFHPGGPSTIMAPDPQWKMYATTKHASVEEARKKKPSAAKSSSRG